MFGVIERQQQKPTTLGEFTFGRGPMVDTCSELLETVLDCLTAGSIQCRSLKSGAFLTFSNFLELLHQNNLLCIFSVLYTAKYKVRTER